MEEQDRQHKSPGKIPFLSRVKRRLLCAALLAAFATWAMGVSTTNSWFVEEDSAWGVIVLRLVRPNSAAVGDEPAAEEPALVESVPLPAQEGRPEQEPDPVPTGEGPEGVESSSVQGEGGDGFDLEEEPGDSG